MSQQPKSKTPSQIAVAKPYQKPTLSKGPILTAVTAAVAVVSAH